MIALLQIRSGYSDDEIKNLLNNKKALSNIFENEYVADFLFDPNIWMKKIEPETSFGSRFLDSIKRLFKDDTMDEHFYVELALVIRNFRKVFE
jgi:hypothetical protein